MLSASSLWGPGHKDARGSGESSPRGDSKTMKRQTPEQERYVVWAHSVLAKAKCDQLSLWLFKEAFWKTLGI